MTSNMHIEGQTTKKYGLPLSHLEYSYIEKCTNIKELEKIVTVLRSGDEGKFPELEMFAEKKLEALNPKSRVLNKERPILRPGDLEGGDWRIIEEDLKTWTHSMQEKDAKLPVKTATPKGHDDIVEVDENLPPVRPSNIVLKGKKQKKSEEKKKKKVLPRDYKEWDKFDVDTELKATDLEEKKSRKTKVKVPLDIDSSGMSEEEKELKANREKDKGNEAFKSQDFEEAVTYYTRSISLLPIAASYNNRALAYLKLKKWDKAIRDCNSVLNIEADNIKALMRRGTAYKSKHDFKKACKDLEKVLKLEPNNKKAEDLVKEVHKEMAQEEKERKDKGGRRLVIEEVDSDDNEATEEVDVDRHDAVNGFGHHDKCVAESLPPNAEESGLKKQDSADHHKCEIERQPLIAEQLDAKNQSIDHFDKNEMDSLSSSAKGSEIKVQDNADKSKVVAGACSSPCSSHKQTDADCLCGSNNICNDVFKQSSSSVVTESVIDASSFGTSQDNPVTFDDSSSALSTTVPQSVEISALSSAEKSDSSLLEALSQEETCSSTPKVSFNLNDSVAETTQAAASQVTSDRAEPSIESDLPRLLFVQLPLPSTVSDLKEKGNSLFRSGQYGEAIEQYSQAIVELEKDSNQHVNLSVLLSNRAVCHLKTGHLSQTVSDCTHSLKLVPHGSKTLLRRAAAYEGLEKYAEAYVDYKHVLSLDKSADQAHQGATRCQAMLQQKFGMMSWRDKIPPLVFVRDWEVPLIVDQAGLSRSMSSTVSLADKDNESSKTLQTEERAASLTLPDSAPTSSQQVPVITQEESLPQTSSSNSNTPKPENVINHFSKEQEFENLKAKGNQYVQKGQYQEAVTCYSTCISLCPDQVACYTNRALCYLKLNKASDAETDCDKALSLQSNNPKALYRRALARRMCQKYKLSLQDLIELLKLEPKNSVAQKEIDAVKQLYKEELELLKKKATAEKESKIRKRVKIEEVDEEEEDEKPRSKVSDKVKGQSKLRSGKQSQQSAGSKSKISNADKKQSNNVGKKQSQAHESPIQGQPVAPPTAPRLMKTTPYEFCQAWNSLKPCQSIQPYADILRQIPPADLPSVISNKLDGQMLQIIVRCVYEEMVLKGDVELGYQILDRLCLVPRFSTVSMFMTSKEKKEVSAVLDILSRTASIAWTSADIVRLKKEYSVK